MQLLNASSISLGILSLICQNARAVSCNRRSSWCNLVICLSLDFLGLRIEKINTWRGTIAQNDWPSCQRTCATCQSQAPSHLNCVGYYQVADIPIRPLRLHTMWFAIGTFEWAQVQAFAITYLKVMAGNDAFGLFNLYYKKIPKWCLWVKAWERHVHIHCWEWSVYRTQSPLHALILTQLWITKHSQTTRLIIRLYRGLPRYFVDQMEDGVDVHFQIVFDFLVS